jgi:hypothetical protein
MNAAAAGGLTSDHRQALAAAYDPELIRQRVTLHRNKSKPRKT